MTRVFLLSRKLISFSRYKANEKAKHVEQRLYIQLISAVFPRDTQK